VRIAVVGTGIAGLTASWLLYEGHDLAVFEANDYAGGHTNTVEADGLAIDTGFIVFNDWTYPNFLRILERIGVASQPSDMSFSVRCERTGLEYNGSSLNRLFAQRRNLLRPSFHGMILDILRFHRSARELLLDEDDRETLGQYLDRKRYGRRFLEHYIVPMGSAIWSTDPGRFLSFPARTFVEFFHNHGMLSVGRRPQWRVVKGGAQRYVEAMTRPFRDRIRLSCPVRSIRRDADGVLLRSSRGEERFDEVVLACHSDQALRMLEDPSEAERDVLGAIPYQENEAALHTDASFLPRRPLARASWNYHLLPAHRRVAVTYHMNRLQSLEVPAQYCVTLNRTAEIAPGTVLRRIAYQHPLYTPEGMAARRRWSEISGVRRTHFCGAYWGYGFHEDGVKSALRVCARFQRSLP